MKLQEVLNKTIQFFKDKKIESARLDAELLFSCALKIPRIQLYVKYDQPLSEEELNLCRDYVRRRGQGEPVAYIVEEKGFYGLTFKVRKGVLIPRPETELIVDEVLAAVKLKSKIRSNPEDNEDIFSVLDLGSGTGCLGFAIIHNLPQAQLISVEKSLEAFQVLTENQQRLQLESRSVCLHADAAQVLQNLDYQNKFDFVVANPPYIAVNDQRVEKHVHHFEPHDALYSDDRGFMHLKTWAKLSAGVLKPEGILLMEMGCDQGAEMKSYLQDLNLFKDVQILKDLAGLDRVMKAKKN